MITFSILTIYMYFHLYVSNVQAAVLGCECDIGLATDYTRAAHAAGQGWAARVPSLAGI